jgi:tetratricopeptide (TPR) repeat protein
MSESPQRYPQLDKIYQRFLNEESSADFIQQVSSQYNLASLERLAAGGSRLTRRAAVLSIGFLGSFFNNEAMGRALNDTDRAVRMLADHGIREIWQRQGSESQQQALKTIYRLVDQSRMDDVISAASDLIHANPDLGEAYNQRAIAYCSQGDYESALIDCRETLQCNRFHFPAAIGLAHCCMQIDEASGALAGYRLALNINPDLDSVRRQVSRLERMMENN